MPGPNFPHFGNVAEFKRWSNQQKGSEVEQWTTDDWNQMFARLYELTEQDPILNQQAKKQAFAIWNKKKLDFGISYEQYWQSRTRVANSFRRDAFMQEAGVALGRLYKHYRLEKKQFDIIRHKAKSAGRHTCCATDSLLRIALFDDRKALQKYAEKAEKAVFEQSLQTADRAKIKIKSHIENDDAGLTRADGKILIEDSNIDDFMQTIYHESAHLHLQSLTSTQQLALEKGKVPIPELGLAFYKLQKANQDFYFSGQDGSEADDKMYRRQPVEKFAEIYGTEAERAYRAISGQTSERGAKKIAAFLRYFKLGKLQNCSLNHGQISLSYKVTPTEEKEFGEVFERLSKDERNQINIRKNRDGLLTFDVPRKFSANILLLRHLSAPKRCRITKAETQHSTAVPSPTNLPNRNFLVNRGGR